MKIAAKTSFTALATILGMVLMSSGVAFAQDASAPGPTAAQVSSSVKEALDTVSVAGSSPSVVKEKATTAPKEGDGIEVDVPGAGKVPKSVTTVVKALNETTENITLDNLNAAREAVVKLDVLIDIEKRLSDLAKLRRLREEESGALSAVVDPSAAMAVGASNPAMQVPAMDNSAFATAASGAPSRGRVIATTDDYEISMITGASGNFAAQIKDGGEAKLVRVGDKLSDGSKVTNISINGVSVVRPDKSRKTFNVAGAPTKFASP